MQVSGFTEQNILGLLEGLPLISVSKIVKVVRDGGLGSKVQGLYEEAFRWISSKMLRWHH